MENQETKTEVKKKEKVEYFTDEMHREMYIFQEGFKQSKSGKATIDVIKVSSLRGRR